MGKVISSSEAIKATSEDELQLGDPVKIIGVTGDRPKVRRALAREKPDFFSGSTITEKNLDRGVIAVYDWCVIATDTDSESAAWDGRKYVFTKMRSRMADAAAKPGKGKKDAAETTVDVPDNSSRGLWSCGRVLRVGAFDNDVRLSGLLLLGKE